MSDQFTTHLANSLGPVNGGDGAFNATTIYHVYASAPDPATLVNVRGQTPRAVAAEELRALRLRYVPPDGFGDIRDILLKQRMVLLDGEPGSGRLATARMLLHGQCQPGETFHELLPSEEKDWKLDHGDIVDGDRRLLDLSEAGDALWSEIHGDLPPLRKVLEDRQAYLAVVLPAGRGVRLGDSLDSCLFRVSRPSVFRVLRRSLRQHGFADSELTGLPDAVAGLAIERHPLREITQLAALIDRARSRGEAGGLPALCATAYAALTDRAIDVGQAVAKLEQGSQRALLLATAMLHGAKPGAVHHATAVLLKATEHPQDERPLLERELFPKRLDGIGALIDADGGVRFKAVGYDTAVREHFWKAPELREVLGRWVLALLSRADLQTAERDILVGNMAAWSLSSGNSNLLLWLATKLVSASDRPSGLAAAARVLEHGLNHERYGWEFRQLIYLWSKRELPGRLTQVFVSVCVEVMTVRHPDQAVVRLHHLARNERRTTQARDALLRLAEDDPRYRLRMLDRLATALTVELAKPGTTVDVDLFLALTPPAAVTDPGSRGRPLVCEDTVRQQLVAGWSGVFQHSLPKVWGTHAQQWLAAAHRDEQRREQLLGTLVNAGQQQPHALGVLYSVARAWERSATTDQESLARFAAQLLRRINAVQGVGAA